MTRRVVVTSGGQVVSGHHRVVAATVAGVAAVPVDVQMTAREFRSIRVGLGVGVVAYGRALGYQGEASTVGRLVRRMEGGQRHVPPAIADKARALRTAGAASDKPRFDGLGRIDGRRERFR